MKRENIPNIITVLRIILIIPIFLTLLLEKYDLAFYLCFIAGCSDMLDGFLARRFNWTSRFGAITDPMADKILMFFTYLALMLLSQIPPWLFIVVWGRDLYIGAGVAAYTYFVEAPDFHSRLPSKLNTVVQLFLVTVILFSEVFIVLPHAFIHSLMYVVLFTTVVSFLDYTYVWGKRAINITRARRHG